MSINSFNPLRDILKVIDALLANQLLLWNNEFKLHIYQNNNNDNDYLCIFKALTVVLAVCVSVARSQYYYQQQQPLYTTRQERASPPAPPPYKPAPPPPYAPHPPPSYGPAAYAFDWKVLDDYTKNNYGHQVGRSLFDFMENVSVISRLRQTNLNDRKVI